MAEEKLHRWYELLNQEPKKGKWFIEDRIEELNIEINRLYRRKHFLKKKNYEKLDLEAIRAIPIGEIMPLEASYSDSKRSKHLCPLHNEKTPSFVIFEETNSWYCFGCGEGGSNYDLIMKLHKCTFIEAAKFLNDYL
uniref:Putative primase n=1 Tax=viral metagenome TaxID=1070528 RepID=A0A6M3IKY6_9ZZZZ